MEHHFLKVWNAIEDKETLPRQLNNVNVMEWEELYAKVHEGDPEFADYIVNSIYSGDAFIFKGAYTREFLDRLKEKAFAWGQKSPSQFHKIFDGVPDFHRVVDPEIAESYSFKAVRHVYYFFPWNDDPLGFNEELYQRIRTLKYIGGFDFSEYETNIPSNGIIDRFVISHFPKGVGMIETHSDPYVFQRTIMVAAMSKRGEDYQSGGVYFVNKNNEKVDLEGQLDVGDYYLAFPTVQHGVEPIDPGETVNWDTMEGRWWVGFYTAVSNIVPDQDRHTGQSIQLDY